MNQMGKAMKIYEARYHNTIDGRTNHHIGYFPTREDAEKASKGYINMGGEEAGYVRELDVWESYEAYKEAKEKKRAARERKKKWREEQEKKQQKAWYLPADEKYR